MARRQSSSRGRDRRGSKKTNPLPFILGGIALLAVVLAFALSGGDDEESKQDDKSSQTAEKTADTTASTVKKEKPKGDLKDGRTKAEWRKLRKEVDMSIWREVEAKMADALRKRDQALKARKTGNEKEFEKLIKEALGLWREGTAKTYDFDYKLEAIDENLWDNAFDKEAKKLQSWNKAFRGYLSYENK